MTNKIYIQFKSFALKAFISKPSMILIIACVISSLEGSIERTCNYNMMTPIYKWSPHYLLLERKRALILTFEGFRTQNQSTKSKIVVGSSHSLE